MPEAAVVMTITGFTCPIDSLDLGSASAREDGDPQSRALESHVHVRFIGGFLECANGHRWRLDDTVMNRIR